MIGGNALLLEDKKISGNSLVIGVGKIKTTLSGVQVEELGKYSQHYLEKNYQFNKELKIFNSKNK